MSAGLRWLLPLFRGSSVRLVVRAMWSLLSGSERMLGWQGQTLGLQTSPPQSLPHLESFVDDKELDAECIWRIRLGLCLCLREWSTHQRTHLLVHSFMSHNATQPQLGLQQQIDYFISCQQSKCSPTILDYWKCINFSSLHFYILLGDNELYLWHTWNFRKHWSMFFKFYLIFQWPSI